MGKSSVAPKRPDAAAVSEITFADVAAIEWTVGTDVRSIPVDVLIAVLSFAEERWYRKPSGWDRLIDQEEIHTRIDSLRGSLDHIVGHSGNLETCGVDVIADELEIIGAQVAAQVCRGRELKYHGNYRVVLRPGKASVAS